jgi:acyl carrier protein
VTDAEILAAVENLARVHLGWSGPLRPEMRLVEELGLDSLKRLTLAIEIENHFRIRLDDEEESEIETIAALIAAVRSRLDA